jgi:hypothetical protein
MVSVKESIEIDAHVQGVWDLFSRVQDWPRWWDGCLEAELPTSLAKGAKLNLSVRFGLLSLKFSVTIVKCDPPYELTWIGRGGGLKGVHSWRFQPEGDRTLVTECEEYSGPGLIPFFLVGQVAAARRMFKKSLLSLKALAEAECGPPEEKGSLLAQALRWAKRR